MKKLIALLLACIALFSLCACGGEKTQTPEPAPAPAQEPAPAAGEQTQEPAADPNSFAENAETYNWKCAVPTQSASIATDYAALLSEKTEGRVNIEIMDLSALGAAADVLGMVRDGTVQMVVNSAAQTPGEFPVADLIQVPFFFKDNDEASSTMWELYQAGYAEEFNNGTHCLMLTTTDGQVMAFADKKVESLADFSGMKVRVVSGVAVDMIDAFGGTPVTMATSDVYLSLSTGIIDSAVSSPLVMLAASITDVSKYLCDAPLYFGSMYALINGELWDSLPADLQQIMTECGEERIAAESEKAHDRYKTNVEEIAAAGVEVYVPSEAFLEEMHSASAFIIDDYVEMLNGLGCNGEEVVAHAQDYMAGR